METIYRVTLGGIHDVKATLSYTEAKAHYLVWVEELMNEEVSYKSVILSADHSPIMEYVRK